MKGSLLGHGLFEIPSRGPCDSNMITRVIKTVTRKRQIPLEAYPVTS